MMFSPNARATLSSVEVSLTLLLALENWPSLIRSDGVLGRGRELPKSLQHDSNQEMKVKVMKVMS